MLEVSGHKCLTDIKTLNLHGNCLTRFIHMGTQLAHLNTLVLCFNELSQLDEVSHLVCTYSVVSFKPLNIRSMQSVEPLNNGHFGTS